MQTTHNSQPAPRRAFTLLELMVVMGIIAVLASLATYAAASFVANARVGSTESLVLKIDRLIASRREAFDRFIIRADKRSGGGIPEYMTNAGDKNLFNIGQTTLAKALARKRWYRRAFPQTFAEAGITTIPPTHVPETESAEMLYYLLTNAVIFGEEPVGTGDFLSSQVADTDGDGYLEFVDAWGEPLRFYRWPTRLIRPQGPGDEENEQTDTTLSSVIDPQSDPNDEFALYLINTLPDRRFLGVDQDDEFGVIDAAAANPAPPLSNFNPAFYERNFHTLETWSVPLVLSTGEDRELGLYEPNAVASDTTKNNLLRLAQPMWSPMPNWSDIPALQDNISNLYLRTGGR